MVKSIPNETIERIREEVLKGKGRCKIAGELGLGKTTIYRYASDLPGKQQRHTLSKETIKQIRFEVLKGKSKYQIAKEMKLSFNPVYYHTRDLPNKIYRETGIQGKTLDLLTKLLENGYVESNNDTHSRLRKLKRFLPMIQRAQIDGQSIYYLSDKNKEALRAIIKRNKSRIISYRKLAQMTQVFGINLSTVEKDELLNKNRKRVPPVIRRKDGGFLSSFKKTQAKLDDFMDQSRFLSKNGSQKSQKFQQKISNSLQGKSDSLVDFYIRMYCTLALHIKY